MKILGRNIQEQCSLNRDIVLFYNSANPALKNKRKKTILLSKQCLEKTDIKDKVAKYWNLYA